MNLRPLAALALAGTLVAATVGTAFADGGQHKGFDDLSGATWAQGAITLLASQGLVNGVTTTQFDPQGSITLEQLAAILMRYEGKVSTSQTFSQQVRTAEGDGLFSNIGGAPNLRDPATRAQAMAMIATALNLKGSGNFGEEMRVLAHFHDGNGVPGWARKALALAVQLGVIQGSAGDLMPGGHLTRAQLAVILQRLEALLGTSSAAQGTTVQGIYVGVGAYSGCGGGVTQQITLNVAGSQSVSSSVYGSVYGGQESFPISPNAQVFLGNHPSTLSSFQAGDSVTLTLDGSGEATVIVDTQGQEPQGVGVAGTATGKVTAVNGSQVTIASSGKGQGDSVDGNLGAGTYTVESSANVVVSGAAGTLSQVQVGDYVRLIVDETGQVSTVIVLAQPETLQGTALLGTEDWLMLQTQQGPMRVMANDQTTITLNGSQAKLSDIAQGDQVTAVGVEGESGLAATTITATGNAAMPQGGGD